MWMAYAGSGGGVVVQSTYDKLRDSLPGPEKKNTESAYIGCVRYLDYQGSDWISPGDNTFSPYIHKRVEFDGEKEVRIICAPAKPTNEMGIRIPIDTGGIIDAIRAYPGAPVWIRVMLTDLVRQYGLELDVCPSELDAIPIL